MRSGNARRRRDRREKTCSRSLRRVRALAVAFAAAALLEGLGLAAPAAAQGVIATGSGRAGATVAGLVALIGVVAGGLALARSAKRSGAGSGRDGAIVALVLGLVGVFLAVLHLATSSGGVGTGDGRAGAVVALALGLTGVVLGRLALVRSSRTG